MKKLLIKALTILIYCLALLWFVDFQILILFDLKSLLMVFLGTCLLTLSGYKKRLTIGDYIAAAKWNSQVTAYLTTFIQEFALLSAETPSENLLQDVALNCRPLLYALVIYILLHSFSRNLEQKETKLEPEKSGLKSSHPDIMNEKAFIKHQDGIVLFEKRARELGLTERETIIATFILQDLSNKEIGNELFISENTVKKHVSNLFRKLEINNREQLKHLIEKMKNKD